MNRKQLDNLCEVNGIVHYQLKNKEDLLKVFGIKIDDIEGFKNLSDENKDIFTKFLINYYNVLGVDSKLALQPLSINLVDEEELIVKEVQKNNSIIDEYEDIDIWQWFSTKVYVLDENFNRIKLFKHSKEKEIQYLLKTKAEFKKYTNRYLRFNYVWFYSGRKVKEWLHVKNQNEWY